MNYIGEFSKNSTILLELLTKDELKQPIGVDNNPQATIEYSDVNGITTMESVTLNAMENEGEYSYTLVIPYEWKFGQYIITYAVSIEGEKYQTQETFQVSETNMLLHDNRDMAFRIIDLLGGSSSLAEDNSGDSCSLGESGQYVYPPDFQLECEIIPTDYGVKLIPKEALKFNHSFMVVLGKEIKSVANITAVFQSDSKGTVSKVLKSDKHFTFTSEYKPMYATPLEVRSILREFFTSFKLHDIYVALRDAGEKTHQWLGEIPDANNARFRLIQERNDNYFPMTKYVMYEASRTLLTTLLVKLLNAGSEDGEFMQGGGASITLGDFAVDDKLTSGAAEEGAASMGLLKAYLKEVEHELKFWQDSMMGRNRRGYAKPLSAVTRQDVVAPESRDF